jgi:hypothetical protein
MAENRGPEVQGVAILFLVLSWVFVSLRCYVRGFLLRSFGVDDTLCVVALVSGSINTFLDDAVLSSYEGATELNLRLSSSSFGRAKN